MKSKITFLLFSTFISTTGFSQVPTKQWDAAFGGSGYEYFSRVLQTSDGGYLICGSSPSGVSGDKSQPSNGNYDFWIVKTDGNGVKQWDRTIGGNHHDYLNDAQETSDGGFILGGFSISAKGGDVTQSKRGGDDYWIVKTDANGIKQWDARFGGDGGDQLYSVQQTTDGGYILGGWSDSPVSNDKSQSGFGDTDYWIVKTDANGVKQWDAVYGGSQFETLYTVKQTSDGGYILGGYSDSPIGGDKSQGTFGSHDYWLVKTDANGVKEWDADFGGTSQDRFESTGTLIQTSDGGYVIGGFSDSPVSGNKTEAGNGQYDYWIVKADASGAKLWDKSFGGTEADLITSITEDADGGLLLAGTSNSGLSGDKTQDTQGGPDDYWIVKTDQDGNKIWDVRFGGSLEDFMPDIQVASDGGYIIGGYSDSPISGDKTQASQGSWDYWIVKTNSLLAPCNIPDGLFVSGIKSSSAKVNWTAVAGAQTYSLRYRQTGTIPWTKITAQFNFKKLQGLSPSTQYDWQVKSVCDPVNNISSDWSSTQNFTTKLLRLENENDNEETSFEVFPNPVLTSAVISFSLKNNSNVMIELFSLDGKRLATIANENFSEGTQEMEFNRAQFPAGVYLLKLVTEGEVQTKKLVLD